MKRLLAAALALVTIGALAGTTPLLDATVDGLRTLAEPLFERGPATQPRFDRFHAGMVAELPPQARAERALELSINRFAGASEYVMAEAQGWRGRIEPGPRLDALITTAINSPRIEIRMAGFEVYLAQYGLEKSADEVDRLIDRMIQDPRGAGPWALWSIAVIGARGIDRERVFDELLLATDHPDVLIRRWAVDALAKLGGQETIDPLLAIAAGDPSAVVRERAFCGLAQSGTLHVAERYLALPGLLAIVEDPQADARTQEWAYQALREITHLDPLPEDPAVWRERMIDLDLL